MTDYNATLEAFRNCWKSDYGINPPDDTTEADAQAWLVGRIRKAKRDKWRLLRGVPERAELFQKWLNEFS